MDYLDYLFNLKDKIAIVTGGNGQLGTEYAKALARAGAKVAIFDVHDDLNENLREFSKDHQIALYRVDITKKEQIIKSAEHLEQMWGTPSILINNAGLDSPPGAGDRGENVSLENYSVESWNAVMNVNATGTFLCCQVIGEMMSKKGGGSIINISSHYGIISPDQRIYEYRKKSGNSFVKPVAYSASKSAILNLTRYLATYWAASSVRVNTLVPGGVFNNQDQQFLEEYAKRVPLGRMARSDEYNGVIVFLASDASSYMTGSTIVIDGGWTAW